MTVPAYLCSFIYNIKANKTDWGYRDENINKMGHVYDTDTLWLFSVDLQVIQKFPWADEAMASMFGVL